MGRSIIAHESIEDKLIALIGKEKVSIGLLLGHLTRGKDYIVHVAATPKENGKEHDLGKLDDKWIAHHATQVLRMLPGGLSVVGIFVIAPPDVVKAAQAQLRQALFTVEKKMDKIYPHFLESEKNITDRILLQLCSVSKKLTCRTFDVADNKSSARPADWRYGNLSDGWLTLQSQLAVNVSIPVNVESATHSLEKQIQAGLMPTCEKIQAALCTMNGALMAEDASLDAIMPAGTQGKKGGGEKGKGKTTGPAKSAVCDVKLLYCNAPVSETKSPEKQECLATLVMRGSACSRAFIHSKGATIQEAQKALKEDMCRSLLFRCQLLCEDLLQSEEEQDPSVVYECPVRVFATVPGAGGVQLCDYVFQDEGGEESAGRFHELLGLSVDEGDIDMTCERIPEEEDLAVPVKVLPMKQRNQAATKPTPGGDSYFNMIGATVSSLVAILAAGIGYMYMGQD